MGDNRSFLPFDNKVEKPNNSSCGKVSGRFVQEAYSVKPILAQAVKPVNPSEHKANQPEKRSDGKAGKTGDVTTEPAKPEIIDFNDSKKYHGCLPNDKEVHKVNLSVSDNVPTKGVYHCLAGHNELKFIKKIPSSKHVQSY